MGQRLYFFPSDAGVSSCLVSSWRGLGFGRVVRALRVCSAWPNYYSVRMLYFYLLWGLVRLRSLKAWFTLHFRTYSLFLGELLPLVAASTLKSILTTLTTIHSLDMSIVLDTILI